MFLFRWMPRSFFYFIFYLKHNLHKISPNHGCWRVVAKQIFSTLYITHFFFLLRVEMKHRIQVHTPVPDLLFVFSPRDIAGILMAGLVLGL